MVGIWAELSVVRHQLRVLEMGDDRGDLAMISSMRYKVPSTIRSFNMAPNTLPRWGSS